MWKKDIYGGLYNELRHMNSSKFGTPEIKDRIDIKRPCILPSCSEKREWMYVSHVNPRLEYYSNKLVQTLPWRLNSVISNKYNST